MLHLPLKDRGFTLVELMLVVAVFATVMAMAVPMSGRMLESIKHNSSAREVERELQSARLKAVSVNRRIRVAFNCPVAGQFRTVEYIGTPAIDNATNRCLLTAYPAVPDNDPATRPNFDGPVRQLQDGMTVTTRRFEFRPDGTAWEIVANTPTAIANTVSVVVTKSSKTKTVTVNALGKVVLQ